MTFNISKNKVITQVQYHNIDHIMSSYYKMGIVDIDSNMYRLSTFTILNGIRYKTE